jgi:glycerate kinase
VIAIAGTIGKDASINIEHGIDAFTAILETPCELSEAIELAPMLVTNAAERMVRMIVLGYGLPRTDRLSIVPPTISAAA